MQRIDQHTRVRLVGNRDQPRALLQVLDVGPRHRLDVHRQPERRAEVAQRGEIRRQPRQIRIVAGDQHVGRAEARAGLEHRDERTHVGVGLEAQDLDVADAHAGVGETAQHVADHRRVADRRVRDFGRRCRNEPQADVRVAGIGGTTHHVGWRELEHGERGKGQWSGGHCSGENLAGVKIVDCIVVSQSGPPLGGQRPAATASPRMRVRSFTLGYGQMCSIRGVAPSSA